MVKEMINDIDLIPIEGQIEFEDYYTSFISKYAAEEQLEILMLLKEETHDPDFKVPYPEMNQGFIDALNEKIEKIKPEIFEGRLAFIEYYIETGLYSETLENQKGLLSRLKEESVMDANSCLDTLEGQLPEDEKQRLKFLKENGFDMKQSMYNLNPDFLRALDEKLDSIEARINQTTNKVGGR